MDKERSRWAFITIAKQRNLMPENETKWKQDFFDEVESIKLNDPLSWVLGAQAESEPFVFTYKDTVKMAGHSCPAVSSAYKITALALKALYPPDSGETPVRGNIRVLIKGTVDQLAYGPQSQVFTFITGASGSAGFKGLQGKFSRKDKLSFDEDFQFCTYIFERADNNKAARDGLQKTRDGLQRAVKVTYDPTRLTEDPRLSEVMPKVMDGSASSGEREEFGALWQGKVKEILLSNIDGLFTIEEIILKED